MAMLAVSGPNRQVSIRAIRHAMRSALARVNPTPLHYQSGVSPPPLGPFLPGGPGIGPGSFV